MNITKIQNNIDFKGYDAIRLKGLYMQGLTKPAEKRIFNEMKQISNKEGLKLYINLNNTQLTDSIANNIEKDELLSIWGQDRKAFVENSRIRTILWHSSEKLLDKENLYPFNNYETKVARYFPRGGNYYIGYNENGEKWLLISRLSVYDDEEFKVFGDLPRVKMIPEIFDIKPENICYINEFTRDLDESVRPIGYPYILINDFEECSKNIKKLEIAFPNSHEIINRLKKYAETYRDDFMDSKISALKSSGFIPIKIGADYEMCINFINALAFKNNNDKISYITNSTKGSCPELEYLEQLFEEDLREKVPNIENIYFVSGSAKDKKPKNYLKGFSIDLSPKSFECNNAIMDILANRHGGIHCMTAEIPNFDKLM